MKDLREYGIKIGTLQSGKRNLITDVKGVKVGHATIKEDRINTGVTAILPHSGNMFKEKVYGAVQVINGFGKTIGTVQLEELGTIETPILLTNTLNVGKVSHYLVQYMLKDNEDIGTTTGTINPIVCECNDGYLNHIRGTHVEEEHVLKALEEASEDFEEGAVGAGTGMSCFDYKGGIGSSSRIFNLGEEEYTIGALVLSNFGLKQHFILNYETTREYLNDAYEDKLEQGSIIIIIATDAPLCNRQLKRVAKRAGVALGRLGSFLGNGSGDIVIAFSTANRVNHYEERGTVGIKVINENLIDRVFKATVEATEEAILKSMIHEEDFIGRDGNMSKKFNFNGR